MFECVWFGDGSNCEVNHPISLLSPRYKNARHKILDKETLREEIERWIPVTRHITISLPWSLSVARGFNIDSRL